MSSSQLCAKDGVAQADAGERQPEQQDWGAPRRHFTQSRSFPPPRNLPQVAPRRDWPQKSGESGAAPTSDPGAPGKIDRVELRLGGDGGHADQHGIGVHDEPGRNARAPARRPAPWLRRLWRKDASSRKSTMRGSTPPASVTPPRGDEGDAHVAGEAGDDAPEQPEARRFLAVAIGERRGDHARARRASISSLRARRRAPHGPARGPAPT